ncbi:hypothetical protein GCK72_001202 [Caenorhabditis remanei]|uniref:Uncharacterized protein n=1 Tax=Caenorhabditis remanei TaxID=31234 RepID=A0A6A5HP39_CAERE|nr:hypothetical protein GCK72_001202 [Caenorhabditis remanei]KAF1769385.1 hypothetical protein GCK72_001202 [Caenorhabditis remanei]
MINIITYIWQMMFDLMFFNPISHFITFILIPTLVISFQAICQQNSQYRLQLESPPNTLAKTLIIALFLYILNDMFRVEMECSTSEYADKCYFVNKYINYLVIGLKFVNFWVTEDFFEYFNAKSLDIVSNGKVIGKMIKADGKWKREAAPRKE